MIAWTVEIVIYAALAIGATRLSWHRSTSIVGLTLILCAIVTNMAYFGSSFQTRLTLELFQAVAVMVASRISFRADPTVAAAMITGFAALDTAFCGAMAFTGVAPEWQGVIFGWFTNGVFAIQCFCVAYPGVTDALASRRDPVADHRHLDNAHLSFNDHRDQGRKQ